MELLTTLVWALNTGGMYNCTKNELNIHISQEQSTCLASSRPSIQSPVTHK